MAPTYTTSTPSSSQSILESMGILKSSVPIGLQWRSSTFFIAATVGMGAFTDMFLYGLIVPVLPFMLKDRVNIPESQMQGTISYLLAMYAGASSIASPIAGILADRFSSSRQLPFLLGLALLFCSTILLAIGRSIPVLALARLLQGASGGVVWTVGLALLIETVGQENLGKTLGTVFSFISVAGLFSPMIGGILYEKSGYAGVFGLGITLVSIDFSLRLVMIEKKVAARYTTLPNSDSDTAEDATENSPLLQNSTPSSNKYQLPEPEHRITRTFPILLLLRNPALLTAFFIGLVQATLLGGFDATIPLVASSRYGFNSLKAGLLFFPLGGADFLLGPVFGWCVDRWGSRLISILGFTYLIPALALLRLIEVCTSLTLGRQIALYSCLLALNGVGLAMINPVSMVESGDIVEKYWKANADLFQGQAPYAQLYGISSMVWSVGLTIGPLIAGSLRERIGYGNMNAVLAGICGFTAILSAIFLQGSRDKKAAADENNEDG